MKCATVLALIALHLLSRARADELDQQMLAKLSGQCEEEGWACLQEQTLRALVEADERPLTEYAPGYQVARVEGAAKRQNRSLDDPDQYLMDRTWDYLKNHQLTVKFSEPENGARELQNLLILSQSYKGFC